MLKSIPANDERIPDVRKFFHNAPVFLLYLTKIIALHLIETVSKSNVWFLRVTVLNWNFGSFSPISCLVKPGLHLHCFSIFNMRWFSSSFSKIKAPLLSPYGTQILNSPPLCFENLRIEKNWQNCSKKINFRPPPTLDNVHICVYYSPLPGSTYFLSVGYKKTVHDLSWKVGVLQEWILSILPLSKPSLPLCLLSTGVQF